MVYMVQRPHKLIADRSPAYSTGRKLFTTNHHSLMRWPMPREMPHHIHTAGRRELTRSTHDALIFERHRTSKCAYKISKYAEARGSLGHGFIQDTLLRLS